MSCNSSCRYMYSSFRRLTKREDRELNNRFKGHWVDGPSGARSNYYWVRLADGSVAWEGTACCKWTAKLEALSRMTDQKEREANDQ